MDLRRQRIENEWAFLERVAQANPRVLLVKSRTPEEFAVILCETAAPLKKGHQIEILQQHELRLSFGRFFPTVPMEAYLAQPVFHPNIHPTTGFVCLWQKALVADTVVEALIQLQRILSYSAFTESPDHVMQPEALAWAQDSARGLDFPFHYTPLEKPADWDREHNFRHLPPGRRHRLS
jgi:ubiquitin-protein ligase